MLRFPVMQNVYNVCFYSRINNEEQQTEEVEKEQPHDSISVHLINEQRKNRHLII